MVPKLEDWSYSTSRPLPDEAVAVDVVRKELTVKSAAITPSPSLATISPAVGKVEALMANVTVAEPS